MSRNNVTMIDDLPYLEDLEKQSYVNGVPAAEMKQVSKFIRDTAYNPPYESGMGSYSQAPQRFNQAQTQQPQTQFAQIIQQPPQMVMIEQNIDSSSGNQRQHHHQQQHHPMHRVLSLSCIDVAEHATNCIVCSKLYNTDTSLYIIVISILLLVAAILFKKVLDLQKGG